MIKSSLRGIIKKYLLVVMVDILVSAAITDTLTPEDQMVSLLISRISVKIVLKTQ